MSKLILEVIDHKEDDFKMVFLSDFRNDEPEFQFDFLDAEDVSLLDKQITIRKEEAMVLIAYLSAVLER